MTISQQDYSQQKKQKNKKSSSAQAEFQIPVQHANDFIDPNEPLYCFCRQVSFGRMIGCESDACKYEWFHFECVGLKEEPDVWYCSDCQAELDALSEKNGKSACNESEGITSAVEMEVDRTHNEVSCTDEAPSSTEVNLGTYDNNPCNKHENTEAMVMGT